MPDSRPAFVQGLRRDRAALTAGIIISTIADAFRDWAFGDTPHDVCGRVADILRDEFDDVRREAAGERIAGLD